MRKVRAVAVLVVTSAAWLVSPAASAHQTDPAVKVQPPTVAHSHPGAAAGSSATNYFYVYDQSTDAAHGASGDFVVGDPAVPSPDLHSLAELSVASADGHQIVEEGWTVDPGQFGDTLPHLFVFHWVNNKPACYNGCGFVPTNSTVTPGIALRNGTTHTFKIYYSNGRWHVLNNGKQIGYFPQGLWSTKFHRTHLTQWFGEVAATTDPPCAQMGDGLLPADPSAAVIRHMSLVSGPAVNATPVVSNAAYYGGKRTAPDAMRFGGPGGCGPQPQMITFLSTPPDPGIVNGPSYTVVTQGGGSGNPVTLTIAAISASVCSISGQIVSFTGPGRCEIDASQAGNTAFTPAAPARQVVHVRIAQAIHFVSSPPRHARAGGHVYRVAVTGGDSGKPVVLSVGKRSRSVCTLHGKRRIAPIHAGRCTIHASQAGNALYAPAHRKRQSFRIRHHR